MEKQQKLAKPYLFKTTLPDHFEKSMRDEEIQICVVIAHTGSGKTIVTIYKLAEIHAGALENKVHIECYCFMPFRASIEPMHTYLGKLFPKYTFGYAMRGNANLHTNDNVRIMTTGYGIEYMMSKYRENGLTKTQQFYILDEFHDATWQTDFAFRVLIWMQNQGAPIKIIIASATLDVTETLKEVKKKNKILAINNKEADIDMIFLDEEIQALDDKNNKLSNKLNKKMIDTTVNIANTTSEGNILMMLPGQDDINAMCSTLENIAIFKNFMVYPLHSQLSREENNAAIRPDPNGQRKVIIATNIVENAITIDGILFVIDCGYRKINEIDSSGVSQLVIQKAAQSNIKQASGRAGRQGIRGKVFLMMTKDEFYQRPAFSANEVHRNPLYLQIIKLVRNHLPVSEVLSHIPLHRITFDTSFLVNNEALKYNEEGELTITPIGELIANLPLSIKAGHFLASFITTTQENNFNWYIACIVATWIDCNTSVFFRPSKKPRETVEAYEHRLDDLREKQSEFYSSDCLSTMLNVWFASWVEPHQGKLQFNQWCINNGIFDKTLKEMNNLTKHIIKSLKDINIQIKEPTIDECSELYTYIEECKNAMIPYLIKTFREWVFVRRDYSDDYRMITTFYSDTKYSIDRNIKIIYVHDADRDLPEKILALNLKRIAPNRIIMSNIITIPKTTMTTINATTSASDTQSSNSFSDSDSDFDAY
jgi:HrpA-like RNA helicase